MPRNEWQEVESALTHLDRVLLYGPPGTGKTYAAMTLGLKNRQVYPITMTEETPAEALRGHYLPVGSSWDWMDGPATVAWRGGDRLVINEIDHALGDALDWLHVVCDDPEFAEVTLPKADHEKIRPAKGFQAVATMNGDPNDLPPAVRDRFVCVNVTKIAPPAIKALPDDLRAIAKKLGETKEDSQRVSIRSWNQYAHLRQQIDARLALQIVFGTRGNELSNALSIAGKGTGTRR